MFYELYSMYMKKANRFTQRTTVVGKKFAVRIHNSLNHRGLNNDGTPAVFYS